jgi:hypothetical protein
MKFEDFKKEARAFDLIFFKGGEIISDLIRYLEKERLGKEAGEFSHVGMIITTEILDHPKMKQGELYVWESTMSGFLSDDINNIEGTSFFGSQVRNLEELVKAYTSNKNTKVAWARLKENPLDTWNINILKEKFKTVFNKYNHKRYDASIVDLLAALFPCMRGVRDVCCLPRHLLISKDWLFCSELCFAVYQSMGLYDNKHDAQNVVPADLLGYDEDNIPCLVDKAIKIKI